MKVIVARVNQRGWNAFFANAEGDISLYAEEVFPAYYNAEAVRRTISAEIESPIDFAVYDVAKISDRISLPFGITAKQLASVLEAQREA